MKRLTQEEMSESDVTLEMTYVQFDSLPREICELLRLFIGHDDGRRITYTVPAYLYREMGAIALAAAPAQPVQQLPIHQGVAP